jgi:hypothetical protein
MSGYTELRDLGVAFVPPDGPMPTPGGRWPQFSASWSSTVELLARELRHLDAKGISIELDMEPRMFRQDGLPRSDARARSDGVRLSFSSKYGPLRYETAEFTGRWGEEGWKQNIRAIALGLEALRKVDRYGVSKRGEQYRGWKALPTGTDPADAIQTREQAEAVILSVVGAFYEKSDIADGGPFLKEAVRMAQRQTHPDRGGDTTEFRKVMKAAELVGVS